jgi:hypothetical protein
MAGLIYLYYVNRSSTEGYFLRQRTQELNSIAFNFEILKTRLLEQGQANRETIQGANNQQRKVVDVSTQVVKLPGNTNLTYKN